MESGKNHRLVFQYLATIETMAEITTNPSCQLSTDATDEKIK